MSSSPWLGTQARESGRFKDFFDANKIDFAAKSRLPMAFYQDLATLEGKIEELKDPQQDEVEETEAQLNEQLRLLNSVRKLEDKLAKMKARLAAATRHVPTPIERPPSSEPKEVVLTREDYKSLVDLYFYTHHKRFDPGTPDSSPTPLLLEDYVFKLSEDFAPMQAYAEFDDEDKHFRSPFREIEERLKTRQLREITVTQAFVDLLLDDRSSNAALFEAYKKLPQPGMAFLPRGIIRLFLQRMSTPWQKSAKSMIRYLSLIDDAQKADVPITQAEWASAIYLAGRSFKQVTQAEVDSAFLIWRRMEHEAGVKSHHVTFNILFDIAVRANKFPLAQLVLKEMHDRGFRLNRLGRVSIIYYHGLRGDGDAVRKAYRDFVDAGEIVDTLVLNCVIAALYNAQEPTAAEQIYERMKSLQQNLRADRRDDGQIVLYRRYPGPGEEVIEHELASNHLDRILNNASKLKSWSPSHHQALQDSMPLRPDHITFRTMISHHINVSGNLNRVTVLLDEMDKMFNLPPQSITFQLLFKGFALHGRTRDPDAMWSIKRLEMVWEACREAIRAAEVARRQRLSAEPETTLPSVERAEDISINSAQSTDKRHPPLKRMSTWDDFVLDLAVFPNERRKPIERVHAELFDEEKEAKKGRFNVPFLSSEEKQLRSPSQGQETYYALGDSKLDHEEGEYVLPSPSQVISSSAGEDNFVSPLFPEDLTSMPEENNLESPADPESYTDQQELDRQDHDDIADLPPVSITSRHQVTATRGLVCWLLRAYAASTGSRESVENVWNSVRRVWKSQDQNDKDSVVRVLRRCLRDCDRYGPPL
ncbi:hypothetical protein EDD36DRAFT_376744 [Exophiala viscosa]|uniref:Pentatricopeptide repeat protein n=1 Tax=Exophiala viscosa TaxID=2486360 RepID=A0AAN6E497_9EURO|nr:hypothetical protein EDD36DRAFT_376744 [Exophiala viscosa]